MDDEFDHACEAEMAGQPVYGMNLQSPAPLRYDLLWIMTRIGSRFTYMLSDAFDALGTVVQFRGMIAANKQHHRKIENDLRSIVGVGSE